MRHYYPVFKDHFGYETLSFKGGLGLLSTTYLKRNSFFFHRGSLEPSIRNIFIGAIYPLNFNWQEGCKKIC